LWIVQGQPGVDGDHQAERDNEPEDRIRGIHHGRADHHPDRVQVVGGPRHQVAGPMRLEIRDRQLLQVREEVVAHVVLDVARHAREDPPHQEPENAADDRDPQQERAVQRELGDGDARRQIVDRKPENPRRQERHRRRHDDACEAAGKLGAVSKRVAEQPPEGSHRGIPYSPMRMAEQK
jgi:hypothetical protein